MTFLEQITLIPSLLPHTPDWRVRAGLAALRAGRRKGSDRDVPTGAGRVTFLGGQRLSYQAATSASASCFLFRGLLFGWEPPFSFPTKNGTFLPFFREGAQQGVSFPAAPMREAGPHKGRSAAAVPAEEQG